MIGTCKQCGHKVGIFNLSGGLCLRCRVNDSENIPTIKKETNNKWQKTAYIAFKALGLISFWASFLIISELSAADGATSGLAGVIGIGIFAFLGIPLLLAISLGPILSLFIWRDRDLMFLTIASFVLIISLSVLWRSIWPPILILYGVACMSAGNNRLSSLLKRITGTNN